MEDCVEHAQVKGPLSNIEVEEVEAAMKQLKSGKTSGPTSFVIELLKAKGERCLKLLTKIFKKELFENKLPGD